MYDRCGLDRPHSDLLPSDLLGLVHHPGTPGLEAVGGRTGEVHFPSQPGLATNSIGLCLLFVKPNKPVKNHLFAWRADQ